jgi:sugar fermentation stimulation protein A
MRRAKNRRNMGILPPKIPFYWLPAAAGSPDCPLPPLLPATFLGRPNRFLVLARVEGRGSVRVASRDPGRLRELLVPGVDLLVSPSSDPRRKTGYTMVLVRHLGRWVSVIPALANSVFESALARGAVEGLAGARVLRREVSLGSSRFDFLLFHRRRRVLAEVKSATLVMGGRALFPDAPTARGARHLVELTRLHRRGQSALVVFLVQRSDAESLSPHAERDPRFADALSGAIRAGVGVLAYTCRVSPMGLSLERRIPVRI